MANTHTSTEYVVAKKRLNLNPGNILPTFRYGLARPTEQINGSKLKSPVAAKNQLSVCPDPANHAYIAAAAAEQADP